MTQINSIIDKIIATFEILCKQLDKLEKDVYQHQNNRSAIDVEISNLDSKFGGLKTFLIDNYSAPETDLEIKKKQSWWVKFWRSLQFADYKKL